MKMKFTSYKHCQVRTTMIVLVVEGIAVTSLSVSYHGSPSMKRLCSGGPGQASLLGVCCC